LILINLRPLFRGHWRIGGAPFYISCSQYEVWKHTDLIIDVVPVTLCLALAEDLLGNRIAMANKVGPSK